VVAPASPWITAPAIMCEREKKTEKSLVDCLGRVFESKEEEFGRL
jgi:hypothetical protein